ncbi:MAG: hypothetical protein SWE60_12615 [Thermodesulfobacteriota bacterium]|nr:hypothetical protein [Thermodesulfobacteriota bacterium]
MARYVESKMMEFDCILENREDASALKETVEAFLRDLEDSFRAAVHQEEAHLSFYEERKRECLEEIAAAWNAVVNAGGRQRE